MSDHNSIYQRTDTYMLEKLHFRHFEMCADVIKCLLFHSYCTSLYCSTLWLKIDEAQNFHCLQIW